VGQSHELLEAYSATKVPLPLPLLNGRLGWPVAAFLDEIGDMPTMRVKLLRVRRTNFQARRVGSNKTQNADVRIIRGHT
jgi:hypothetical protein